LISFDFFLVTGPLSGNSLLRLLDPLVVTSRFFDAVLLPATERFLRYPPSELPVGDPVDLFLFDPPAKAAIFLWIQVGFFFFLIALLPTYLISCS
jgi:hypothetical protein